MRGCHAASRFTPSLEPTCRPMVAGSEMQMMMCLAKASDALSAGDIVNRSIRQHGNWGLMPFAGEGRGGVGGSPDYCDALSRARLHPSLSHPMTLPRPLLPQLPSGA